MKCEKCKQECEWIENKAVYGRNYGKSYMIWLCRGCGAYVGCHNNTKNPKGSLADQQTRQWRMTAHSVIDPLHKNGDYSRGYIYKELSNAFGEPIHIGESDIKRCKEIIKTARLIFNI